MNNIITLGEFVNILKKTDFFKDRTDSEQIVLAFFQSIADALKNEDTVSIKGRGDFKVVSRDSGLILFTPDRTMADTINEPFA
ncbi:MAG: HU family DNA-binding protein, partial [Muribaculaceae bacterium]|nr:HU family DNA-binding protein [Muribaculaceae bacterium]